jgi:hypothetical protein
MKQTVFILLIIMGSLSSFGQKRAVIENLASFDESAFHFGFVLGYNKSNFRAEFNQTNYSFGGDSLIAVGIESQPGFNLGIVSSLNISPNLKLRFVPSLSFQERKVNYTYSLSQFSDSTTSLDQRVESTFLDFPVYLKFRTLRANNFAAYVLGGVKYSVDMASQKDVKLEEILKIKKPDFSYELGIGTDFFLEYFKFGLELKFSMGITNSLIQENNRFSRPFDNLRNQMWLLSITFEG